MIPPRKRLKRPFGKTNHSDKTLKGKSLAVIGHSMMISTSKSCTSSIVNKKICIAIPEKELKPKWVTLDKNSLKI